MYGPAAFLNADEDAIADLIQAHPLAVLAAATPAGGVVVAHAPLQAERDQTGAIVALIGHVARANPFAALPDGAACTAVFVGPDAYVSPSAYPSKQEHGRVVPTWNYIRAEVEGRLSLSQDSDTLTGIVSRLTDAMEAVRRKPWAFTDAPEAYRTAMLQALVGVRVDVIAVQGKWKLSQNRAATDAAGVMADLATRSTEAAQAVRRAMQTTTKEG
jgi:transcriptional regulator